MAAAVSAWAQPSVWALDSDEDEAELLHQHNQDVAINKGADTADFPSLATAASMKSKKKKPQTISLQEFATYGSDKPAQSEAPKGLTPDELLLLPTGPRQRSPEDLERNKLGGGFRSCGYRDEQPRRLGSFNRDNSREYEPSKADERERWAAGKKSSLTNGFERKETGGFFTDSLSRAGDSDNWGQTRFLFHRRRGGMRKEEPLDQIRVIGPREGRLAEHSIVCGKEEGFLNRMVSIPRHGGVNESRRVLEVVVGRG